MDAGEICRELGDAWACDKEFGDGRLWRSKEVCIMGCDVCVGLFVLREVVIDFPLLVVTGSKYRGLFHGKCVGARLCFGL